MKKLSLALSALLLVSVPISSSAQTATHSLTSHYSVEFAHVKWYQKVAMFFLGLNWSEFSIRTTFSKDEKGGEKVIEVIAWPDNTETENPKDSEIAFRLNNDEQTESFLDFVKKTKFKSAEVPSLLDLYTYLYDEREQEIKFDSANLFEKEDGTMHSKFTKKRDTGGNTVSILTLNGSGAENGWVEVIMKSAPEKHLEKITAKLKIGIMVTFTPLKKEEKKED